MASATPPPDARPVSLRESTEETALIPSQPAAAASGRWLMWALLTLALVIVAIVLTAAWTGNENSALSEEEVRRIAEEVARTQIAALPAGSGAASGVDVQRLVDEAVGTQVAMLRPTNTPVPPTPTVIPPGVAEDDDAFKGSADAAVVIVEFSDFQCPYCGRWYEQTLPRILEAYPTEVKFVYRDFPIFGEDSLRAAQATECAEEQSPDKFWAMHDRLFVRLTSGDSTPLSQETLVSYAQELDLDTRSFAECLSSQRYRDEVERDYQAAVSYGLRGTPGFVINGVVYAIGAQPFDVFDQIIQNELARVSAGK